MAAFVPLPAQGSQLDISQHKNGPHRSDGKPQIPAGPTRADGRIGRGRARPGSGPRPALAQARPALALQATAEQPRAAPGRAGHADLVAARARICGSSAARPLEVAFGNELPAPAVLNWRGIDGVPAAEPLTARAPLAAGGKRSLAAAAAPRRHLPVRPRPARRRRRRGRRGHGRWWSRESEPVAVDRDEVLLIEDWRLRAGRHRDRARASIRRTPRRSTRSTAGLRSKSQPEPMSALRLRFINGCQRTVIAIKIEKPRGPRHGHRRPAGRAVPGPQRRAGAGAGRPGRCLRRCDGAGGHRTPILLHDGKEARPIGKLVVSGEPPVRAAPLPPAPPLPSNGLPERLDLKSATRVDLALGGRRPTG